MNNISSQNIRSQNSATLAPQQELTVNLIAVISAVVAAKFAALGALILTVGLFPTIGAGALSTVFLVVGAAAALGTFLLVRKIVRNCFEANNSDATPPSTSPQPTPQSSPANRIPVTQPIYASVQTPVSNLQRIQSSLLTLQGNLKALIDTLTVTYGIRNNFYKERDPVLEQMIQEAISKNEISETEALGFNQMFRASRSSSSSSFDTVMTMLNTYNFGLAQAIESLSNVIVAASSLSPFQQKEIINQGIENYQPLYQQPRTLLMPIFQKDKSDFASDNAQSKLACANIPGINSTQQLIMIYIYDLDYQSRLEDSNIVIDYINKLQNICDQISNLKIS